MYTLTPTLIRRQVMLIDFSIIYYHNSWHFRYYLKVTEVGMKVSSSVVIMTFKSL